MKFILGQKLGMSQVFGEEGKVEPVTVIEAGPCFVTQVKSKEKLSPIPINREVRSRDDYEAIQVGFKELKEKKVKKPQKHKPFRYLREFRGDIDISKYKAGQKIDVSIFKEGERVKISGVSKGKGFAGAVKRWGFAGKGASHGVKHEARTLGSIGSSFPERVIKGKKMPGRMGSERITIKNLQVIKIDAENNLIAVRGAVPGRKGTLLEIRG